PPETSRAKSLRGRESRPGASATRTRPSRSTSTAPEAHLVAAVCVASRPCACMRAASTTDPLPGPGSMAVAQPVLQGSLAPAVRQERLLRNGYGTVLDRVGCLP